MSKEMPTDEKIKETFQQVERMYSKGDNWSLRITADTLGCPVSYVREVLMHLEEKGEL